MPRTYRSKTRTPRQANADRYADDLAKKIGKSLRDGRHALGRLQADIAEKAGISRTRYTDLEARPDGGVTLTLLSRAAMAIGGQLHVYISKTTAADLPKDAVHLRHQELIVRTAVVGRWQAMPEQQIDRDARTTRAADVLLRRDDEWALLEVWDLFSDVGASFRDWDRRLAAVERLAISRMGPNPGGEGDPPLPRVGGCWVVRATRRNRSLVASHRHLFQARFPGPSRAWLLAVTTRAAMPEQPALLWISVDGSLLYPSRLG